MESISPQMLLGAALVVVPVAVVVWFLVIVRQVPPWLAAWRVWLKTTTRLKRTLAGAGFTASATGLFYMLIAGLQLLDVPLPSFFQYRADAVWVALFSGVCSLIGTMFFDSKPKPIEDWLDWKHDDEAGGSAG